MQRWKPEKASATSARIASYAQEAGSNRKAYLVVLHGEMSA